MLNLLECFKWLHGEKASSLLLGKHILLENSEDDLMQIHKSALENLNQHFNNWGGFNVKTGNLSEISHQNNSLKLQSPVGLAIALLDM